VSIAVMFLSQQVYPEGGFLCIQRMENIYSPLQDKFTNAV